MPKAGKINVLILFLIEFWIEKSHHQNQDRAKSWKNQFLKTFLYWNFLKKWIWKWNLCRGTIKMLNTHQIVYICIYIRNRTVRTPPHHQRFFQNQWTMYKNSIYKFMCPNRIYIYIRNRTVRTPPPPSAFFSKINELCIKIQYTYIWSIYIYINEFALKHKLPKAGKNHFFKYFSN